MGGLATNFWAAWGNETALNFGNGQSRMAGKTHNRIWQSTYEPDKIYACGLSIHTIMAIPIIMYTLLPQRK